MFGFGKSGDLVRRDADVVLVMGSRLGKLDLPFDKYWGDPDVQKIIQIDVDPRHLGRARAFIRHGSWELWGMFSAARDGISITTVVCAEGSWTMEVPNEKARASRQPAVVCLRTNCDANLSLPADVLGRFVEVYRGSVEG